MSSGGAILTKAGQPIRLNLQLWDGDIGKFPQATLKNTPGVELVGSPVDLTHSGNGLYEADSITMPDTEEVTATFKVFNDSGHLVPSEDHSDAFDLFRKDEIQDAIDSLLLASRRVEITMVVEDTGEVDMDLAEDESIQIEVQDQPVQMQISEGDSVGIEVDDTDIDATVGDC